MRDPVDRAVRAIARRNSYVLVWAQFGVAHLVVLGAIALLRLYQPMSNGHFWLLAGISQAVVSVDNLISIKLTRRMWRPVWRWERGARDEASTIAAWRTLATLPLEYLRRQRKYPFVFGYLPFIAFTVWLLNLDWWAFFVIGVAGTVALVGGLIIRYFAMEIVTRPVLEEIATGLPEDFQIDMPGLPLRWRMLAAAPAINVITGVVVAGLATRGGNHSLSQLGVAWLIAVGVSFTISLELAVLAMRALASALADLRRATDRVGAGDYSARVPVVSADEAGRLAQSFNSMVEGLDERERLREAFGAYVDPGIAERVLAEGVDLAGEEVEATMLFLDVRDFTAFAERSTPHQVVTLLTGLWELVVPVLLRHGGHANKFIGDGLLGVFGAPNRYADHADRAVAAALEIAALIRARDGDQVGVGIGVNTGTVVVGTVGGGGRVEFTVIGDAVNTASRVEAATRETGDEVLITEATRCCLSPGRFECDERPPIALKGKAAAARVWAPRAGAALGAHAVTPSKVGD
ncbi:MAG TPA: adenylate/guanylate cyclase domain-containing protein [Solirubrobacteraceae bacterium]|nr:adenylate/guanylate cyclase domain-containing protein [Solirubrobacteraceae bacterium]